MRITFTGHVGMLVETCHGSVLCDPWFTPAYFGSWFVFPRNDRLDPEPFSRPDYLYVSHLHLDHFDPTWLRDHLDKRTKVLLPDFPVPYLEDGLRELGFTEFVRTRHGVSMDLDGLEVAILAMTAPADGPVGDSAIVIGDGETRILNQNDARPRDPGHLRELGPYDGHFTQFSGAIWFPMVYDFPPEQKRELGERKRAGQLSRALQYIQAADAAHVFPVAGPPCFLDDDLFALNDLDGDPANIFPDQPTYLAYLREHGVETGELVVPGTVVDLRPDGCTVTHPTGEASPEVIFADKRAHLEAYRADWAGWLEAEHASWPRGKFDVLAELRDWFEPLLADAPLTREGVGGPVLLLATASGDAPTVGVVIDFPAGRVREWDGAEHVGYRIETDRALVEACIERRLEDWVNALFLSCRFRAHRDGPYNEYVYTFFKCLSPARMAYAERYYASRTEDDETFRLGDHIVQRYCPHLGVDLQFFGHVVDGCKLHCSGHNWEWDLETGRCLNSDRERYRLRTRRAD